VRQDSKRVEEIYKKLTGHTACHGERSAERHALAQKIVHVEHACKSVLEAIRNLRANQTASPVQNRNDFFTAS
jgi:hypothetical protein